MELGTMMISLQSYLRAGRYLRETGMLPGAGEEEELHFGPGAGEGGEAGARAAVGRGRAAGTGAFGHILVAVGPNERSAALQTAVRLAEALNARLFFVYVYTPLRGLNPEFGYIEPDVHDDTVRDARARLDRAKARVPEMIPCETVLREGDPAEEIIRAAEQVHADLIVMGTRGRGRVAQALMGSVATAVIHKAPCPVLTVAPTAAVSEAEVMRRGFAVHPTGLGAGGQKAPPGSA